MNDERLGKEIGALYRETDVTPPDSQESARQVAARLRRTPQVKRRRWLPVWWRRTTHPPNTNQTTDYQPGPIPASNGHTPTVTGRTKLMFSPVKAITAGALVFALGGVLLIAQPFDQQGGSVPGAATDAEGMTPALVTGSLVSDLRTGDFNNRGQSPDRITRYELTGEMARAEMSDPRLNGSVTTDWTQDQHAAADFPDLEGLDAYFAGNPGGAVLKWGTLRIENDTGAWEGTLVETLDVTAAVLSPGGLNVGVVELVGSGAYDGLSAVLFMRDSNFSETDDYIVSWNGIIFPGNLPPDR